MPRQQRLIARESDLTVGETLRHVNVGGTRLNVVAADLLGLQHGCSKKQHSRSKKSFVHGLGTPQPRLFNIVDEDAPALGSGFDGTLRRKTRSTNRAVGASLATAET